MSSLPGTIPMQSQKVPPRSFGRMIDQLRCQDKGVCRKLGDVPMQIRMRSSASLSR